MVNCDGTGKIMVIDKNAMIKVKRVVDNKGKEKLLIQSVPIQQPMPSQRCLYEQAK